MYFLVKLLVLACFVGYFDNVCSSLETRINFEKEPYVRAIKGTVTDKKGNICEYHEIRKPGSGPRSLSMDCKKPAGGNAYACEYKGNPHKCNWYNKPGNQAIFYNRMAAALAKLTNGACSVAEIEIKDCPGVIFEKLLKSWQLTDEKNV